MELQRFLAKFTDVENQLLEERRQHLELQHKFKEEEESLRQEKKQHAELQRIKYEIEERLKYEEEKKRNIESEYTTYAEGMQKKVKVLESNLTERSLESTALHRKLTEAESGSQDQILTLSQRNKVLEDHLLQANHALKDAQQNGDKLDKLVLEKLQEIHQLSLQQQKQDFHMQELQRKQALQTETLQSLQDELQLKTTKLQEVEHRENECLQEKKVLARQVAEWTQKHSQLQQDFDFKTKQWTALTQTLQETEQMLTSLQQKHSQLQQEKDQLQLDLQHANRDLEYHKKQVVMMQQENERKEHELQEQHQRRMKHLQDQEALFLHSTVR